jgi:hypothetical protein
MTMLFCAGLQSWDNLLLTLLHPARMQGRIQIQTYFVHKEELEIVSEALFSSLPAVFRLLSWLPCPANGSGHALDDDTDSLFS